MQGIIFRKIINSFIIAIYFYSIFIIMAILYIFKNKNCNIVNINKMIWFRDFSLLFTRYSLI